MRLALLFLHPVKRFRPQRLMSGLICPFHKGLPQKLGTTSVPVNPGFFTTALCHRSNSRFGEQASEINDFLKNPNQRLLQLQIYNFAGLSIYLGTPNHRSLQVTIWW
jgi:hypothetical protein